MTTYITKAASDHAAAFCQGAESQAPLIAQLERQVDAMRSAILHAIATSERISAGADVCDEWALELLALRLAAGRGADHVAILEDRVKQLTEAVEVQEARLEMAAATKRVSQQRFARIQELEEQLSEAQRAAADATRWRWSMQHWNEAAEIFINECDPRIIEAKVDAAVQGGAA